MSRIGKKPISIPNNVQVKIENKGVVIIGPKGKIFQPIPKEFLIEQKDKTLIVFPKKLSKKIKALWGTTRAILQNNIVGVNSGFEKQLELRGIGYRVFFENEKILKLEVGFSHPIKIKIPEDIKVVVEKNIIKIFGIEKAKVGEFAAKIRAVRKPEPYKGKGIRYLGERIRKKEGKKAKTA